MTEVWFRNPHNYIRELAEVGVGRIAWDRGVCIKKRIDPVRHAKAYMSHVSWRMLLIGEQGSAEYTSENGDKPVGVYPTFDASSESMELLEEMMQYPLGEDEDACGDESLPDDVRPVFGQEHRVVVANIPNLVAISGRKFIRAILDLQEEYPDCIVHLHGLYSWRASFGMGFRSSDIDPRTLAGKGRVYLPTGKQMIAEKTVGCPQWVTLLGMNPVDLTREPRNRCIYNIKSALWAADNFMENIAFASTVGPGTPAPVDTTSKVAEVPRVKNGTIFSAPAVPQPDDKINCDSCSLQTTCKYYRQGSVCSVPGSEPAELAKHFKTRDADTILDGLGTLLALQARRLDKGLKDENLYGELDPEVTKMANQLFTNGSKLAKLVDPHRFAGPGVQVNVNGGNAAIQAATPNQVMGSIVRELESRGIPRENITPEMVSGLLGEMSGGNAAPRAVEGRVISESIE